MKPSVERLGGIRKNIYPVGGSNEKNSGGSNGRIGREAKPMTVPSAHKIFVAHTLPRLEEDARILGCAAAGSWITGELDEHSDLDLVIVTADEHYEQVLGEMDSLSLSLGTRIAGFTGEHVGVPNMMICLYEDPLLHVDLKFVSLSMFTDRIENPEVLWERDGQLTKAIEENKPSIPHVDMQWVEDRFWTWVHYGAARIARGEIFEAIDTLAYLRARVLGPMLCAKAHRIPRGVRRIEKYCPEDARLLETTVAPHDARKCAEALRNAARVYVELRENLDKYTDLKINRRAEMVAMKFLHTVSDSLTVAATKK
jgi:hypothetical protein